jgi:hypothetical protein
VEPVAPDAVSLGQLSGKRIQRGALRHRAVERRIEDGHHGDGRICRPQGGFDRRERRTVVEGSQLAEILYVGHDVLVDQGGAGEAVSAVDNPVPKGLRRSEPRRDHLVEDDREGRLMVGRGDLLFEEAALRAQRQGRVLVPYALHEPPGKGSGCAVYLDQLELERRAPTVDGENPHRSERGIRNFAADDGHRNRDILYLFRRDLVGIAFQHDRVPQLAFGKGSFPILLESQVSGV